MCNEENVIKADVEEYQAQSDSDLDNSPEDNTPIEKTDEITSSEDNLSLAINVEPDETNIEELEAQQVFIEDKEVHQESLEINSDSNYNNDWQNKYEEVLSKYEEQQQELNLIKERLNALESMKAPKFEHLIKQCLQKDAENWQEDEREWEEYRKQVEYWNSANEYLFQEISNAILKSCSRIRECGELMRYFQDISHLYNTLSSRYQGLELIQRMLERLQEPIATLKNYTIPSTELLRVEESELVNLIEGETEEKQVTALLDKKLKEVGNTRYQSIRECRELGEKLKKQWLNFIEKKFLPILDGVEDGKQHSETLIGNLEREYPQQVNNLQQWLATYSDLRKILLGGLGRIGVTRMSVEIGKPVDYLRHEPISAEADSNLDHESVKEIIRNGYEYKVSEELLTLRSAQVVVVKNR